MTRRPVDYKVEWVGFLQGMASEQGRGGTIWKHSARCGRRTSTSTSPREVNRRGNSSSPVRFQGK